MANITVSLDTTQKTTLRTAPNGALKAALSWTLTQGDATIQPSADGSTCDLISGSTDTVAIVSVTDTNITETATATISLAAPALATDLGLSADAPVSK